MQKAADRAAAVKACATMRIRPSSQLASTGLLLRRIILSVWWPSLGQRRFILT
jgi:hypothetical protein